MKQSGMTKTKKEMRQNTHLARPPRLETGEQKKKSRTPKKPKAPRVTRAEHKPQSYTAQQRKDYQLRSKRH